MPTIVYDLSSVELDDTEERYLASKSPSTEKPYRSNLKRFKGYYPEGVVGLIKQIEHDTEYNTNREI